MLKMTKNATLNGSSIIDGVVAATFYGSMGENEYVNMSVGDMNVYMNNIQTIIQDQQEFMAEYQKMKEAIAPQLAEEKVVEE